MWIWSQQLSSSNPSIQQQFIFKLHFKSHYLENVLFVYKCLSMTTYNIMRFLAHAVVNFRFITASSFFFLSRGESLFARHILSGNQKPTWQKFNHVWLIDITLVNLALFTQSYFTLCVKIECLHYVYIFVNNTYLVIIIPSLLHHLINAQVTLANIGHEDLI